MDKLSCSFHGIPFTENIPLNFICVSELKDYTLKNEIKDYSEAYSYFNGEKYINRDMLKKYMKK